MKIQLENRAPIRCGWLRMIVGVVLGLAALVPARAEDSEKQTLSRRMADVTIERTDIQDL